MDQKLRRDAQLRANVGSTTFVSQQQQQQQQQQHPSHLSSQLPYPPFNPSSLAAAVSLPTPVPNTTSGRNSSSLPYHQHIQSLPHQQQHTYNTFNVPQPQLQPSPLLQNNNATTTTTTNNTTETEEMASQARQEWQQYGKHKTQILEDLRHGRYCSPSSMTSSHHHHHRPPHPWKIGKIQRAEERVDIAGAPYTTYLIHIWDRSTSSSTATDHDSSNHLSSMQVIERRYSDFCKLYNALVGAESDARVPVHTQQQPRNTINTNSTSMLLSYPDWYEAIKTLFPNKHWTGRIGNWSPAKYVAPQQYHNTIQERIQAFDAWLVYVLYAYNLYPQQVQEQQQYSTSSCVTPFLTEQQNTIVHDYINSPSPPPPYMIRSTLNSTGSNMENHDIPSSPNTTTMMTTPKTAKSTTSTILQYHNPVTFTLSSAIRQATTTIQIMTQQIQHNQSTNHATSTPTTIPIDLLQMATGIVFLTVAKLGMIVSGRVGTGVFIAKRPILTSATTTVTPSNQPPSSSSWSAPVAVGTIGLGWGAVVGGDVTHYMIVFTTEEAVRDFGRNHTVHLGTELGISIGPTGMAASQQIQSKSKNILEYHSTYAYAISSGLFLGVSLEGSMISIRHDVNAKFYGQTNISVADLLQTPGVPAAEPLYDALDIATRQEIPEHAIFKISRYLQTDDEQQHSGVQR